MNQTTAEMNLRPLGLKKMIWADKKRQVSQIDAAPKKIEMWTTVGLSGQVYAPVFPAVAKKYGGPIASFHLLLFSKNDNSILLTKLSNAKSFAPALHRPVPYLSTPDQAMFAAVQQTLGIKPRNLDCSYLTGYFYEPPVASRATALDEFIHLFIAKYDGEVIPDPAELDWAAWFEFSLVNKLNLGRLDRHYLSLFPNSLRADLKLFIKHGL